MIAHRHYAVRFLTCIKVGEPVAEQLGCASAKMQGQMRHQGFQGGCSNKQSFSTVNSRSHRRLVPFKNASAGRQAVCAATGASKVADPVKEQCAAFAPATVANLGPGFDWMGCAVEVGGHGKLVRIIVKMRCMHTACTHPWVLPTKWRGMLDRVAVIPSSQRRFQASQGRW
jgi:hypothetical protein